MPDAQNCSDQYELATVGPSASCDWPNPREPRKTAHSYLWQAASNCTGPEYMNCCHWWWDSNSYPKARSAAQVHRCWESRFPGYSCPSFGRWDHMDWFVFDSHCLLHCRKWELSPTDSAWIPFVEQVLRACC
jgi:hypothetical protein